MKERDVDELFKRDDLLYLFLDMPVHLYRAGMDEGWLLVIYQELVERDPKFFDKS